MSAAHTKGPWVSEKEVMKDGRLFMTIRQPDVDYDIGTIAYVTLCPEEVEANARLIAAAPELLEVVSAIDDMWSDDGEGGRRDPIHARSEAVRIIWEKLRAARAKAVQP